MPVGFQSISDQGTIQIDSNFQNYVQGNRGTYTVGGWWESLTYTGAADGSNLVFIHQHADGASMYSFGSTGGGFLPGENWYFPKGGIFANISFSNESPNVSGVIDYITLSNTASMYPPDLGYGMQIFDGSGKKAFDATATYLQIVAIHWGWGNIILPEPPAGKKYFLSINAMTMTNSDIYLWSDGSADETTYGACLKKHSNNHFEVVYEEQWFTEHAGGGVSSGLSNEHKPCVMVLLA